jgi:tetratricopeptide (TPR) repeat protein
MKTVRTVLALATALVVAGSAAAQSRGNGRLSGKVVDEQGQPIIDVQIRAQKVGDTEPFSGKSDKKGEWRLNGLADGQWKIVFSKAGLEPNETTFEMKNEKSPALNVTMTKPMAKVDPTAEINAELQKAATLAQGGKIADARKIYEDLLVKYPSVYQLHGFIARAYAADNQVPKAIEEVKIVLEKEPNNVEMKLLMSDLLMETGDKAEAKKLLDGIDMTQVKDPFPFLNAAIAMINEKKGTEAAEWLTKLLPQFPTQAEIYYYRGRAHLVAEKYDEAKADLEKFISMAPNSKEAADAKKIVEQLTKK